VMKSWRPLAITGKMRKLKKSLDKRRNLCYIILMKTIKETYTSYDKIRKTLNLKADIIRARRHIWYCELVVAACAGASLALAGVIAHLMITGPA
jgi:hypothetical protein